MSQPGSEIPTRDEIQQLPRLAIVAFAARCARRAFPRFCALVDSEEHVLAVKNAIELAESFASVGFHATGLEGLRTASRLADAAAAAAINDADDADNGRAACVAAYAAAYAADTAAYTYADDVSRVVDAAYAVAVAVHADANSNRRDFEFLLSQSRKGHWTDATTVRSTTFPPLDHSDPLTANPNPVSLYDPTKTKRDVRLKLAANLPEGVDATEAIEGLLELYQTLNEAHLARGGAGLKLEDFRRFVNAHIGVEV